MEDSQVQAIVGSITLLRTEMNQKFDGVYSKFDDLSCSKHGERLAKTEQWVEGHKNGERKDLGKEQLTLRRFGLMIGVFGVFLSAVCFILGRVL